VNDMQKQALPGYKDLAKQVKDLSEQVEEDNKKINLLIAQQKITNKLLKDAVDELKYIKNHHKEKHNTGVKISVVTALIIVGVAVVESINKGEASWVFGLARFLKGFV